MDPEKGMWSNKYEIAIREKIVNKIRALFFKGGGGPGEKKRNWIFTRKQSKNIIIKEDL